MSHTLGTAEFRDGVIVYFEFNGTVDVACTALKSTAHEVERDWRTAANSAKCSCGNSEPVKLRSDFGCGQEWQAMACRSCMAITDGLRPSEPEAQDPRNSFGYFQH